MKVAEGQIRDGKVELQVPNGEEGATVTALLFEAPSVTVTPEEREWLLEIMAAGETEVGRDAMEVLNEIFGEEERT